MNNNKNYIFVYKNNNKYEFLIKNKSIDISSFNNKKNNVLIILDTNITYEDILYYINNIKIQKIIFLQDILLNINNEYILIHINELYIFIKQYNNSVLFCNFYTENDYKNLNLIKNEQLLLITYEYILYIIENQLKMNFLLHILLFINNYLKLIYIINIILLLINVFLYIKYNIYY